MAASCARILSVILFSVTSLKTRTTPIISPLSFLIGAPLSAMGISFPSRLIKTVWLASPTTMPSRNTRSTGFSAGLPVISLTILKTCFKDLPLASFSFQPVSFSATGFMNVIFPFMSVAITASPMLLSVVKSHFSLSFNLFSI